MEILETKEQLECHCCCSSSDVFICELDNCEYPLCSTCKEKALKIEHKCPGCRRNIIVDIEEENSILEEDIVYNWFAGCENVYYDKIIHFLFTIIMCMTAIIIGSGLFFLVLSMGRLITIIFIIGPSDFWCRSMGQQFIGYFIGFGLLGFLIGFFIVCCIGGLLHECLCSYQER